MEVQALYLPNVATLQNNLWNKDKDENDQTLYSIKFSFHLKLRQV